MTEKVHSLRELMRMQEELTAEIEAVKDEIKTEMAETNTYEYRGTDWKVSWNEVKQCRLDSTALKKALPEIAAQFTRETTSRRFLVA